MERVSSCSNNVVKYLNKYFRPNKLNLNPNTWGNIFLQQESFLSYIGSTDKNTYQEGLTEQNKDRPYFVYSPNGIISYLSSYYDIGSAEQIYWSTQNTKVKQLDGGYYGKFFFYPSIQYNDSKYDEGPILKRVIKEYM